MKGQILSKVTTALAACCLAVAGFTAPAHAAPAATVPAASTNTATTAVRDGAAGRDAAAALATISPTPQQVIRTSVTVPVMNKAWVVSTEQTDPAAVDVVVAALRAAGVQNVTRSADPDAGNNGTFVVFVGGPQENPATAAALARFAPHASGPQGLADGGYVLAVGRDGGRKGAVLSGVDRAGTFYAAQTFRQMLTPGTHLLPGVVIRDWPQIPVRGGQESFYGPKWSYADELAQVDFLARHKQNAFLYHPRTADPHNAEQKWRDPYPPERLAQLHTIIDRATRKHIQFIYRLGPESPTTPQYGICHSDPADLQAIIARFEQLWSIGERWFSLGWDDSHGGFVCDQDEQMFGDDASPKAAAQAYVTNYVYRHFTQTHPGSRLIIIPVKYYGTQPSTYTERLSALLTRHVTIYWTGTSVISHAITEADARAAQEVWDGRPLWIFDNYPVNDYSDAHLHLGPLVNRDPGLASVVQGFTSNEMNQMAPSLIALATSADFTWNPAAYDPETSWDHALRELAGNENAYHALQLLADNSRSSPLSSEESPTLTRLIDALWTARDGAADIAAPAAELADYFAAMQRAPATLRAQMANQVFVTEAKPWLDVLGVYGRAGTAAVQMLLAQRSGDGDAAWQARLAVRAAMAQASSITTSGGVRPVVAAGVFPPFIDRALRANTRWLGATGGPGWHAVTSLGTYQDNPPADMLDGQRSTFFWSNQGLAAGDYVGVDLGGEQQIRSVHIVMADTSISPPYQPTAYVHDAALEYSTDGTTWTRVATYHDQSEITASLPAGTTARYVRLVATAAQKYWIAVNEFTVSTESQGLVSGGPPGSAPSAAADGNPDTAYVASRPPRSGEALTVTLPDPRPLDRVVIVQQSDATATVRVHTGGTWTAVGSLSGGYSEVPVGGAIVDAIQLTWTAGSPAPTISEIIPWHADVPVASVTVAPDSFELEAGGSATVTVELTATRAEDTSGTLTISTGNGLSADPDHSQVALGRGSVLRVPVTIAVSAQAAPGTDDVAVTFRTPAGTARATLPVVVHRATSSSNVALSSAGAVATASCVIDNGYPRGADLANDGDLSTRWGSCRKDAAWLQVALPAPTIVGKVVIHWERAYGKAYRVQTSADGTHWDDAVTVTDGDGGTDAVYLDDATAPVRYVRLNCTERGTKWGYSIWEFQVYPVAGG